MEAMNVAANWVPMTKNKPPVELGQKQTFWVCYRSHQSGQMSVTCAVWINNPENWCDPDDCELITDDSELWWPVGWHEQFAHPEFSSFYQPFAAGEVLAYAEINMPGVPEFLLSEGSLS